MEKFTAKVEYPSNLIYTHLFLVLSSEFSERAHFVLYAGCYGKNFGPKGFGYGQGAGALSHTQ